MANVRGIGLAIALFVLSGIANSDVPTRIDASTGASAQATWERMLAEANDETKSELRAALFHITSVTATEKGWHGIAFHAALSDPSILFIKDKVAGLSAEQIIELANHTSIAK